jgi:GT2 family glycosyltransferase
MLDVTVIIPSWNAKGFLQECIKSIIRETIHYRIKIIVVDNASTDGSPEMVKDQFPQIKLIINKENLGFAKACNIGMGLAKGKYIVIVNSDVIVGNECIDRMFKYMEKHSEIGILGPKILGQDGMVQRSCMGFPTLWNSFCRALALDTIFPRAKLFGGQLMTYWSHNSIRSVDIINGCFWMVRQEALKQVGLLDESFFMYSEDKDWCKRFTNAGWEVVFFPDAEAIHYGGGSSLNDPIRFYIEMQRADLQCWKKHHGRLAWLGYILIILFHHVVRVLGQVIRYVIKPSKSIQADFKIKRSIACIQCLLKLNYCKL